MTHICYIFPFGLGSVKGQVSGIQIESQEFILEVLAFPNFPHLLQFEALYKCYVNKINISLFMGILEDPNHRILWTTVMQK